MKDKQAEEKEILDIFRKVEINMPFLEVIWKVPRYAHFLKELFTNKRKLFEHEKVNLGEHVSAVLTRRLPPKLKDQGMFAIPCKIGKVGIKSLPGNLVYEPEIETIAQRLRGETLQRRRQQPTSLPYLDTSILHTEDLFEFENNSEQTQMDEEDQTIHQLADAPDVQHPLCIAF
ncbi:hypothetical protein V6N13_124353 [Hibiscus sabdariffa]